jgi:hypothetical protein
VFGASIQVRDDTSAAPTRSSQRHGERCSPTRNLSRVPIARLPPSFGVVSFFSVAGETKDLMPTLCRCLSPHSRRFNPLQPPNHRRVPQDACKESGHLPRVVAETIAWLDAHGTHSRMPRKPQNETQPTVKDAKKRCSPLKKLSSHSIPNLSPGCS